MDKQHKDPLVFPLHITKAESVMSDIFYIAAKWGTRSSNDTMEIQYWGLPPATTVAPSNHYRHDTSLFDGFPAAPALMVHTGIEATSPPATSTPVAEQYGWYSALVDVTLVTRCPLTRVTVDFVMSYASKPEVTKETYRMMVDTGCNPTWIFSDYLPRAKWPTGPRYPTSIPTNIYRAVGKYGRRPQGWPVRSSETFNVNYVDGSEISYKLHTDHLYLKPRKRRSGNVDDDYWVKILFGAVTSVTGYDDSVLFDGLLGLSPDTRDEYKHPSFINQLITERDIVSPSVVFYIGKRELYHDEGPSTLAFGADLEFEDVKYPPIQWKSVPIYDDWWKIMSPKKRLNGQEFITGSNKLMHVDTGCAAIWLHDDFTDKIYAGIPTATRHGKLHILPKSTDIKSLPIVEIQMGENGDFLRLHQAAIIGEDVIGLDGWVEGTIQPTSALQGDTSECEYLGLAGMQCMWMKFEYGTAHWQKNAHPYPAGTETTKFSWAAKTNKEVIYK